MKDEGSALCRGRSRRRFLVDDEIGIGADGEGRAVEQEHLDDAGAPVSMRSL